MISIDTKVVISGFGETEYPNIPTFQEISTLNNSLSMIENYLASQTQYDRKEYLFAVNLLDDADFLYSYLDKEITIAEKYKEHEIVQQLLF